MYLVQPKGQKDDSIQEKENKKESKLENSSSISFLEKGLSGT